ncbi:heavy-metal-associated domain-containing protein [Azohydromonas australica]|uniref:heavy-metal-associated domain-containing protein n=1 Tax=Azohydromonas australica TaxID=364039 RepID=UPI000409DBB5|nr:heavy-metal-associated domain-containing protein [Azohydromonas australica]
MIAFQVNDMSCGHCVGAITRAVKATDPQAQVDVDLARHLVRIDSAAQAAQLRQAIEDAGYSARPVPVAAAPRGATAPKRGGGCCCG